MTDIITTNDNKHIETNNNNNNNNTIATKNNNNEKEDNKEEDDDDNEILILLYYYYTPTQTSPLNIPNQITFQNNICKQKKLKGRIRISKEGINGVLSGTKKDLYVYDKLLKQNLNNDNDSNDNIDIDMKYCKLRNDISIDHQTFDYLSIKETNEVVSLFDPSSLSSSCELQPQTKKKGKYNRRRRRRNNNKRHDNNGKEEKKDDAAANDTSIDNNVTQKKDTAHLSTKTNNDMHFKSYEAGKHLSAKEWHEHMLKLSNNTSTGNACNDEEEAILIDARNIYESKIGYFQVHASNPSKVSTSTSTLLTNTRKYSNLPNVLKNEYSNGKLSGKNVYMYCTGGVRCERASQYLHSLQDDHEVVGDTIETPKNIYQLSGGIQRYLDYISSINNNNNNNNKEDTSSFFKGKNFVFDPRRIDPQYNKVSIVGKCIVCNIEHDDYDNGYAPCENKESRCVRCRMLVLCCDHCRSHVYAWGDDVSVVQGEESTKKFLYCGGDSCVDEGDLLDRVQIV